MTKYRNAVVLTLWVLLSTVSPSQGKQSQGAQPASITLSEAIVNRLPSEYRDEVKAQITASSSVQDRWAKLSDDELADRMIQLLAAKPEEADFLIARLEKEPSAKLRSAIIDGLGGYWRSHPDSQKVLEQHIASDPDATVSVDALELLRSIRMSDLQRLLETRIDMATQANDLHAKSVLGNEEELWFSLQNEIMLPEFLRAPPPLFSVVPSDKPIRVLAFGDFGTGSPAQIQTAAAMRAYNKEHPFDFGLTLGDNFYSRGMTSPDDPRWKTEWEDLYGPLGIKFYATLGNHDWYGYTDSPAAEILYTQKSPDWRMPAPYYTFTAGPAQFFAFDTVEVNEEELEWLDSALTKSTARWKVVYGHYHIFSATRGDNKELIEELLPILEKNHVDIYLNGHDHNLQELKPEGGVHFFVSGGGGAGLYDLNPYDRTIYKQKVNGFTVLEADQDHFKVSFIGTDGKVLHETTLTKNP
jgi:tartrate-resistant acid phosphatase type 5